MQICQHCRDPIRTGDTQGVINHFFLGQLQCFPAIGIRIGDNLLFNFFLGHLLAVRLLIRLCSLLDLFHLRFLGNSFFLRLLYDFNLRLQPLAGLSHQFIQRRTVGVVCRNLEIFFLCHLQHVHTTGCNDPIGNHHRGIEFPDLAVSGEIAVVTLAQFIGLLHHSGQKCLIPGNLVVFLYHLQII